MARFCDFERGRAAILVALVFPVWAAGQTPQEFRRLMPLLSGQVRQKMHEVPHLSFRREA